MSEDQVEEAEALSMMLLRIARAYATSLSGGVKTSTSGFDMKFVTDGEYGDVTGIRFIITMDFIDEETNGQ